MADLTAHGTADLNPIEGEVDDSRRKFLLRATIGMGAAGVLFTATPFIESWLPSERSRALGGPTEVDVSKLEAGQMIITIWRRQPIYVTHRTPDMMKLLGNHDARLKDPTSAQPDQPAYCKNPIRARTAEYLVLIGICTHLGCLPKQFFDAGDPVLGADWPGGFRCPCHGSRFDPAGRVFKGAPAPTTPGVPPYGFKGDNTLIIGLEDSAGAKKEGAA